MQLSFATTAIWALWLVISLTCSIDTKIAAGIFLSLAIVCTMIAWFDFRTMIKNKVWNLLFFCDGVSQLIIIAGSIAAGLLFLSMERV